MTRLVSTLLAAAVLAACSAPTPASPTAAPPETAAPAQAPPAAPTAAASGVPVAPTQAPARSPTTPGLSATVPDGLTPEQLGAFSAARLLQAEGDYSGAADGWRALSGVGAAASEARLGLAWSLAMAGDGAGALSALGSGPSDPRDTFVRGLALDATGQHPQAMQALAEFAAANPLVAPAVQLEIAEREVDAGRPRAAADAAAAALNTGQARQLRQRLLEVRARALAALGDNEGAFDAYRQVLGMATSSGALGEQLFHLAQVSRDLGKREAAIQALTTALEQFPSSSTTADALRLLDDLQATDQVDRFVLGRARYFAVDYRNAVRAFDDYLAAEPDGPDAPSARLYRALASLTPGNEPNALRDLDALAGDATLDSDIAAQALLQAGQALEGLYDPDQAEARYQTLVNRFPHLDAAATAEFRLGLLRYVRGAMADALASWDGLIARRDDLQPDDVARAYYWRALALERLGRADEAETSFANAAAVRPAGYYSLRAAQQRSEPGHNDSSTGNGSLEQWLDARGQDLTAAAGMVGTDPALARAQADAEIGLYREGNWEADELEQRYSDRADRLYVLSRRFAELDLLAGATRLGRAAYAAGSIQYPGDAPIALLQAAYPRPFSNITEAEAARYGLDPLLLESTLLAASQFDPWAEDPATGAQGIALISPVHADEAAQALHTSSNQASSVNGGIHAQAWLLADRLRRFDGRPEVALSALSATDRLADGWAVRPGAESVDAYLELVDYEGVRAGLRDVLATRLAYGIAYPTAGTADPLTATALPPEPTAPWIKIARLAGDASADTPVSPAASVGTQDQQAAFARGAALQRDGDFTNAASVFNELVASAADSQVLAAAQLRLGQSLIGARRPAEALQALQAAAAGQPDSVAAFLTGRALADLGHREAAIVAFDTFGKTTGDALLAAQARVAQARCLAEVGRAGDAVPVLEQVAGLPGAARLQVLDVREQLALMRVRAGDVEGARADYQSLLAQARTAAYQSELNYYLGVLASDPSSAAAFFRTAVHIDPKGRAAQAALDELSALKDPYARSFDAGETRFNQNRYREAYVAYSAVLQANPSGAQAGQALYGRGASLVRLGQDRAGVAVLESIADQLPNTADSADGLFRAGRIRESLADLDGAAADYERVLASRGAGARAQDAQFRLGFLQFLHGDYPAASGLWQPLTAASMDVNTRTQASFWLGKALRAAGDEAGARAAWSSASSLDPRGYYGLRARDLLAGVLEPVADVGRTFASLQAHAEDDAPASVSEWVASRGDPGAARRVLEADPGLARADALLAMGLRQPAVWELGAVESRVGANLGAVALLGAWEQERGLYNAALVLAYDVAGAARQSLADGPAAVRRLAYPLPYPTALAKAAQELRVDPLLFTALMLQESLLDQSVESAAQARGLSQLVASTAYEAARALGEYGFHSMDLYQANTSILLGAFTFGERLSRYGQQIFPALAAYNASEFAVDGWLQSAGQADIDAFAEAIPYTETYPYVQRIYENYNQLLELYP